MASEKLTRREFLLAAGLTASGLLLLGRGVRPSLRPTIQREGPVVTCVPADGYQGPLRRLRFNLANGAVRSIHSCQPQDAVRPEDVLKSWSAAERIPGPMQAASPALHQFSPIPSWQTGVRILGHLLDSTPPERTAFILGPYPDHLADLLHIVRSARRGGTVLRLVDLGEAEMQVRMADAAALATGSFTLPFFDLQGAGLVFLFGVDFSESWLQPGQAGRETYRVLFTDRVVEGLQNRAYETVTVRPDGWASLVQALRLLRPDPSARHPNLVDLTAAAGIPLERLRRLAARTTRKQSLLAVPGRQVLSQPDGVRIAARILQMNAQFKRWKKSTAVQFPPGPPVHPGWSILPAALNEWAALTERMHRGEIDLLLVHGADPVATLPALLGFGEALSRVPRVVSFSALVNETTRYAHLLLPDHHPLESWGYQKSIPGDRINLAAVQPVFPPRHDTCSTVDVLLQAFRSVASLAEVLPFPDERSFLRRSLAPLPLLSAPMATGWDMFWQSWLEQGGWSPA